MNLMISVRKTHIEKGECKSPQRCAIAAAIREEYADVTYVAVRTNGITVITREPDGTGQKWRYAIPNKAAKAIIAFDAGEPVQPFRFLAKVIESKPVKPRNAEQREHDRQVQQAKRQRMAVDGKRSVYGRVAGV